MIRYITTAHEPPCSDRTKENESEAKTDIHFI